MFYEQIPNNLLQFNANGFPHRCQGPDKPANKVQFFYRLAVNFKSNESAKQFTSPFRRIDLICHLAGVRIIEVLRGIFSS